MSDDTAPFLRAELCAYGRVLVPEDADRGYVVQGDGARTIHVRQYSGGIDRPNATGVAVHVFYDSSMKMLLEIHQDPDGRYVLSFANGMVFRLNFGRRLIEAWVGIEHAEVFRHGLLDHVLPLYLSHEGNVVFHASGTLIDGRLLGFLGDSGVGKSTLAAAFSDAGHVSIADDGILAEVVASGECVGCGYAGGARLLDDSASHFHSVISTERAGPKHRVMIGRQALGVGPFPIAGLYVLKQEDTATTIRADRLPTRAAMVALMTYSYLLNAQSKPSLALRLENLCRIVEQVPVYNLQYPRDYSSLPEVIAYLAAETARGVSRSQVKERA